MEDMEDKDMRICQECEQLVERADMTFTRDCHGIPFRLVCWDCYCKIMESQGYDGEYYDDCDENLGYDDEGW